MNKYLKTASFIAGLLDSQFSLYGIRFGLSTILDLIPQVGDFINVVMATYLIWLGLKMKIPPARILQMTFNVLINFMIGSIPVFGGVVYLVRKANLKNLEILKKYQHIIYSGFVPTEELLGFYQLASLYCQPS